MAIEEVTIINYDNDITVILVTKHFAEIELEG